MIFQTLEDKKNCVGIYTDNKLIFDDLPDGLTKTWSYSPFLKGLNIDYANLFCEKEKIDDACPEFLKKEWNEVKDRLKYFLSSFIEAKISLKQNCFYDLVPKKFLIEYCEVKNKITNYVFENYSKPIEYNFFNRFNELLTDISFRDLNLDFEGFQNSICNEKDLQFYQKIIEYDPYIKYNMYGSITGRITTQKNSFPIHTFPKTYRHLLKPKNDWFVSFDMNAAELRTSLALLEKDQVDYDLYEKISKEVYGDKLSRKDVKQITTSWLYNSSNPVAAEYSDRLDDLFEKETLINTYWDGKYVYTPFNRKIESDKYHVISYLNQSTFIDLFHRQVIKVDNLLNNKKSFISFLLHDEFVLDVCDNERKYLIDIIKTLQETEMGKFLVNIKVGKDYGNMKKFNLKVD